MEKTKIISIANSGTFNCLIITKNKNCFRWLQSFLKIPGFHFREGSFLYDTYYDKKGSLRSKKKNIAKYKDIHEVYQEKKLRVDVFYGRKRIFITFVCPLEIRKILMHNLEKISEFVEYKKN